MPKALGRTCFGWLLVLAMLVAGGGRAHAATATVSLVQVGDQEVVIPLGGPDEIELRRNSWGNVVLNGGIIGTYVLRIEVELPNVQDETSAYPTPSITLTIRLRPSPSFDTVIMQGTVPGPGGPPPGGVIAFGNATVATGSLAFLRGATFFVTDSGGPDIPLTVVF